jgi:hypothetical protein
MAAPFDREPSPGKGAGGDVLALWAERTSGAERVCQVAAGCGSRFTFHYARKYPYSIGGSRLTTATVFADMRADLAVARALAARRDTESIISL